MRTRRLPAAAASVAVAAALAACGTQVEAATPSNINPPTQGVRAQAAAQPGTAPVRVRTVVQHVAVPPEEEKHASRALPRGTKRVVSPGRPATEKVTVRQRVRGGEVVSAKVVQRSVVRPQAKRVVLVPYGDAGTPPGQG